MSDSGKRRGMLPRYAAGERANHWGVAIAFLVAGLSGLALFHPAFWFLTSLLGGPVWSHDLHPWAGLVMCLLFVPMAVRYWQDNVIQDYDRAWASRLMDIANNRMDGLPQIDKYNVGQKMLFWSLVLSLGVLLVSGFVLWYDTELKIGAGLIRTAGLLHALAAVLLFAGMIVHIYSAVFWIRGSMRAMVRGEVTTTWARHHHPLWARRVEEKLKSR